MKELDNIVFKAIERYYDILKNFGYIKPSTTNDIIVLSYIRKVLYMFQEYITDNDFTEILKSLDCLSNNCIIDRLQYVSQDSLFKDYVQNTLFRITEDNIIRTSENGMFRTAII